VGVFCGLFASRGPPPIHEDLRRDSIEKLASETTLRNQLRDGKHLPLLVSVSGCGFSSACLHLEVIRDPDRSAS